MGEDRFGKVYSNHWNGLTLLIVIVKLSLIGNCFLFNLNGSVPSSEGESGILGRKTHLPACWLLTISASIELLPKPLTTKWVPLQRPLCGSRFRSKITGQFFLIQRIWGGKPLGVIEFKKIKWICVSSVVIDCVMAEIHLFLSWELFDHPIIHSIDMLISSW
jgi:hypothetical protein